MSDTNINPGAPIGAPADNTSLHIIVAVLLCLLGISVTSALYLYWTIFQGKHENVEERVATIETSLVSLSGLNGRIMRIEESLNGLNGRVMGIEESLNGLNGRVMGIEESLKSLGGLNGRVKGIEESLKSLNTWLDEKPKLGLPTDKSEADNEQ